MVQTVHLSREDFLGDRQGRTFSDVLDDPEQPFDEVLAFFDDAGRQRRMEEAEIHHDRPALAGVIRELEAERGINQFLCTQDPRHTKRLRQAVGVVVRMIMERRGWQKTGKKGSLGVRAGPARSKRAPGACHNTGGLACWFLRAERYALIEGMPFRSVRELGEELGCCARNNESR